MPLKGALAEPGTQWRGKLRHFTYFGTTAAQRRSRTAIHHAERAGCGPEEEPMSKARLLSTVATALLLTVGVASAQTLKKDEAPTPAPAAQQKAPAEKIAPNMKAGEKNAETHKAPETVGQAPKASDADKTRATDKGAM